MTKLDVDRVVRNAGDEGLRWVNATGYIWLKVLPDDAPARRTLAAYEGLAADQGFERPVDIFVG